MNRRLILDTKTKTRTQAKIRVDNSFVCAIMLGTRAKMPRQLKVFEFDARIPGSKKYGRHGQVMVYIAAYTQAEVARLMRVTSVARLHNFHQACWPVALKLCPEKPLTFLVKGINDYGVDTLDEMPGEAIFP